MTGDVTETTLIFLRPVGVVVVPPGGDVTGDVGGETIIGGLSFLLFCEGWTLTVLAGGDPCEKSSEDDLGGDETIAGASVSFCVLLFFI